MGTIFKLSRTIRPLCLEGCVSTRSHPEVTMRKGPRRKKKTRTARKAAHVLRVEKQRGKKKLKKPRQPVTPFALGHHLGKSGVLNGDFDSRQGSLVKYPASTLMAVLMMGMLTATTSMRKIETLTTTFSTTIRRMFGVTSRRIADTTLYDFLCRLELSDLNGLSLPPSNQGEPARGSRTGTPDAWKR